MLLKTKITLSLSQEIIDQLPNNKSVAHPSQAEGINLGIEPGESQFHDLNHAQ